MRPDGEAVVFVEQPLSSLERKESSVKPPVMQFQTGGFLSETEEITNCCDVKTGGREASLVKTTYASRAQTQPGQLLFTIKVISALETAKPGLHWLM